MSVSNTTQKIIYTGNDSTSVFAYPFKIYAKTDLVVTKVLIADSSETDLVVDSAYTVSGVGEEAGGNVTLTAGALASTYKLVIRRVLPLTQGADYTPNDNFPAQTHEDALDRLTYITQQLQEQIDRTPTQTVVVTEAEGLPAAEEGKFLKWSSGSLVNASPEVDTTDLVTKSTVQTIAAVKTFSALPVLSSNPTSSTEAARKAYVDSGDSTNAAAAAAAQADADSAQAAASAAAADATTALAGTILKQMQVFTSTGTWSRPAGVTRVFVRCWGAGGGGGAGTGAAAGGGGGGGGYSEGYVTVSGNVTVTIGVAGEAQGNANGSDGTASSFAGGTTVTANGGSGGAQGSAGGAGGTGGSAANGTLNITGQTGCAGSAFVARAGGQTVGMGHAPIFGANEIWYGTGGPGAASGGQGNHGSGGLVIVYW